jgi:hypothetical protein
MTAAAWISTVVLLLFGAAMTLAFLKAAPAGSEAILNVMLGALGSMATQVVSYWVGSSSGSAKKTDLLTASRQTP